MSLSPEQHVVQRFAAAARHEHPFPYVYVSQIFPGDYYAEVRRNLPQPQRLGSLEEVRGVRGYPDRFVQALTPPDALTRIPEPSRSFLGELGRWLTSGPFGRAVLQKFADVVGPRLADDELITTDEAMMVYDRTNYSLGPHTDSPRKLVSVLFYLPADEQLEHYGTSMYRPKDPRFSCRGGPHYAYEGFERVATMPYLPNSLFAFAKTDRSFHGVEPIMQAGVARYLLLYDLYLKRSPG